MARLRRTTAPRVPARDHVSEARLLVSATALAALVCTGMALVRFTYEGPASVHGWILVATTIAFTAQALTAGPLGAPAAISILAPATALGALVALAGADGGLTSPAMVGLPIVPLIAAALSTERATLWFGAGALTASIGLHVAHLSGVHGPMDGADLAFRQAAVTGTIVFATGQGVAWQATRRGAMEGVAQVNARYQALLEGLSDLVIRFDPGGEVFDVIDAVPPSGLGIEHARGRDLSHLLPPHVVEGLLEQAAEAADLQSPVTRPWPLGPDRVYDVTTLVLADGSIVAVGRDVTDARQLASLRDRLVSALHSELRAPIGSLTAVHRQLRSVWRGVLPEEVRQLVAEADQAASHLARLVDDLLDMESLQAGRMTFQMEDTPLESLLRRTIAEQRFPAETRRAEIRLEGDVPAGRVRVDPQRGSVGEGVDPEGPSESTCASDASGCGHRLRERGRGPAPLGRPRGSGRRARRTRGSCRPTGGWCRPSPERRGPR